MRSSDENSVCPSVCLSVCHTCDPLLWSLGCGEQLTKTMLARECADCVKRQQDTTSALLNCFKHKFLGNFNLLSEKMYKRQINRTKLTELGHILS